MRVNLVVAIDRSGTIGADGALPWRLSADLRRFREITAGHPLVMGRRTHESIGRPLPGRLNIVLSRDPDYTAHGCVVRESLDSALAMCAELEEVMVVGGAQVYAEALPLARRLFLTEVDAEAVGEVRFPAFCREEWRETRRETHPADEQNEFPFSFVVLEKRSPGE